MQDTEDHTRHAPPRDEAPKAEVPKESETPVQESQDDTGFHYTDWASI